MTSVLHTNLETQVWIDLFRVRVASDVARNFAIQALRSFGLRMSSPQRLAPCVQWSSVLDEKLLSWPAKRQPVSVTAIELPPREDKHPFQYSTAEIYDLAPRLLPRGQEWKWCEGACRLRGNASLSIRDISSPASDAGGRIICKYCNRSGFELSSSQATRMEASRMLSFAIKCHILTTSNEQESEEKEKPELVCHICINRNRYDGGAGPLSLEGLFTHLEVKHGGLTCIGM